MTAIKKFRVAKGMTQEELAAIMGTSQAAVGMWETGARMPRAGRNGGLAENRNRAAYCGADRTRTQESCGISRQKNEGRNSQHETTLQNTSYYSGNSSH